MTKEERDSLKLKIAEFDFLEQRIPANQDAIVRPE